MSSLRTPLARLTPAASDHPYLAFEKLIPDCHVEGDGKRQHQIQALQRNLPESLREAYKRAFDRRYEALQGFRGGVEGAVTKFFRVKVSGRLAAGLGNASVLENGLSLNHTFGLPYLPGTGLKGMASAMAHIGLEDAAGSWKQRILDEKGDVKTQQGNLHKVLFGDMDTGAEDAAAGTVIFHDAWWDPEPEKGKPETKLPFQLDVMTPHHQGKGNLVGYYPVGEDWPNDWTSPNPISFLTTGGTFRLALTGTEEWVNAAFEILQMAFQHLGFGAKTQIGYGRGDLDELPEEKRKREARDAERSAEAATERQAEVKRQEIERAERRRSTQKQAEGKLILNPLDPGSGLYQVVFVPHTLNNLKQEHLKGLAGEAWKAIAEDAKKRKERGCRVLVTFCLEDGKPILLGLSSNIPPP